VAVPAPVAVTQAFYLVVLFVVLPFVVAAGAIRFVTWRSRHDPPPVRTSDLLAHGEPAEAEILSIKPMGGFLDVRPMVRFGLRVDAGQGAAAFDLEVTQSIPRAMLKGFSTGERIDVRLSADRSAGAVVLGAWPPDDEMADPRDDPTDGGEGARGDEPPEAPTD
jgi:hypothetical protein